MMYIFLIIKNLEVTFVVLNFRSLNLSLLQVF